MTVKSMSGTLVDSRPAGRPARAARTTLAETLRLKLAEEIISGALAPGLPLDEQELAQRFGVSRTPVREAIRQLEASGLVVARAHRGAVVALPTPRELDDMFRAMAELEALCAGLCAVEMNPAARQELLAQHERMTAITREGDAQRYAAANDVFHGLIYTGTGNTFLAEITRATRVRVSPFRRAQFRASGRLLQSNHEHGIVVQAILRGDRQGASEAMRDHIMLVRDAVRTVSRG